MKRVFLSLCLLTSIMVLAACGKKEVATVKQITPQDTVQPTQEEVLVVANGDTVSVRYVGTLTDGEVFDTNIVEEAQKAEVYDERRPYSPLSFTVGQGNMIPGFERGVVGMSKGETKTINITAADGYGPVREDMVQTIPVSTFDEAGVDWQSWEVGEKYTFDRLQGTIVEKTEENLVIDFNHFLAGKDLVFTVTIEDITR